MSAPCSHFRPLSSETGLDAEGTCLTCGTPWDLTDVEAATPRIVDTCIQCGPIRLSRNDIQTTHGKYGGFYTWDCPSCASTVYKGLTATVDFLLTFIGVAPAPPISEGDARNFHLAVHAVDCLAATAEREMAQ